MSDDKENERMAGAVRRTLQIGLTASVLLIVVGWIVIATHARAADGPDAGLWSRAVHGDGTAILGLGLVLLMLTPVARVLVLAVGWLSSRDFTFSLIAFFVLALLSLSVLLGTG
jgi:uncharacterized membrane protein